MTETKKKPRIKGGNEKASPQPGDSDYQTPTQIRNARKRRSKQKKRPRDDGRKAPTAQTGARKRPRVSSEQTATATETESKREILDPSLEYIEKPTEAPVVQEARDLFASTHLAHPFEVFMGPKTKWRTLVKLAVRPNSKGRLSLGLFAPKSHGLVPDSRTSPLHHPALNRAMTVLERLARNLDIPAFAESEQQQSATAEAAPSLKYVIASVERATVKVQLSLVWQERSGSDNTLLDDLCRALVKESEKENPESFTLHSLWVHYHPATFSTHNNAIYAMEGGRWETKHGPSSGTRETLQLHLKRDTGDGSKLKPDAIVDSKLKSDQENDSKAKLSKPTLYLPPTVFRQANIDAFGKIVGQIRSYLKEQANSYENKKIHLLELYGGVGTIGLHMVDLCSSFVCSDENPNNQACFQKSVESLSTSGHRCKIRYIPKNATDMVQSESKQVKKTDWIIVDPPRKGMEAEVCNALCSKDIKASVLVYVSCGFAAFSRDYEHLVESQWELVQACGHVLFPGSNAIETLAFFRRKQGVQ